MIVSDKLPAEMFELVSRMIAKAVAEEREACAKLAEKEWVEHWGAQRGLPKIHDSIRCRSDMEYKGYVGRVLSIEDGVINGEVIGLRDVVTFCGDDLAQAQVSFRDSVDDYLAFCASRGQAPEVPRAVSR